MPSCAISERKVQEAFLAAPPLISQKILDLTVQYPSWLSDVVGIEPWPNGEGTVMEQLIFRGEMPQVERGFDAWQKLNNNTGCNPCSGPDCSYNWTTLGGHSFDKKIVSLMRRDFKSPSYCVKEIQTSYQFKDAFEKIVENLYRQIAFMKEINISFNFLTQLSKKFVIDSEGPKGNPADPYSYRPKGTAKLARFSMDACEWVYDWMSNDTSAQPYAFTDGAPVFAVTASRQMFSHLFRNDRELREDIRRSSFADQNLLKYNFMNTIRGMFLPAVIKYPRRFEYDETAGWLEILPYVNGIPALAGTYTDVNPAYLMATYEEVLFHGKDPFKIFTHATEESLGANTSFGPEYAYMDNWQWINVKTNQDPFQRVGFFATSAEIGLSQQHSEGVYGFIFKRPDIRNSAQFDAEPACPPEDVVCSNVVPAVSCACPIILSVVANAARANTYVIEFAQAIDAEAEEQIQFALQSGGYVTGTVVTVSEDGRFVEVTLPATFSLAACNGITAVFCSDTMGCSSDVQAITACSDSGYTLILKKAIKAITASDVITGYCGDGSTVELTVVSADLATNTWVVTKVGSCDCGGIVSVCVPPSTDATCPSCDQSVQIIACS